MVQIKLLDLLICLWKCWKEPLYEGNPFILFAEGCDFWLPLPKRFCFSPLLVCLPAECLNWLGSKKVIRNFHEETIYRFFSATTMQPMEIKAWFQILREVFHDRKVSFEWQLRCLQLWQEANDLCSISGLSSGGRSLICGFRLQCLCFTGFLSPYVFVSLYKQPFHQGQLVYFCLQSILSASSSRLSTLIKSSLSHFHTFLFMSFFITSFKENLPISPSKQPHILLHPTVTSYNFSLSLSSRRSLISKRTFRDGGRPFFSFARRHRRTRTHQSHICFPFNRDAFEKDGNILLAARRCALPLSSRLI